MTQGEGYNERKHMEQIIASGGSVLWGAPGSPRKTIISSMDALPSEAELAKGNPGAEAVVKANLQAQMASLQQQLAELKEQGSPPRAELPENQDPGNQQAPKGDTAKTTEPAKDGK